MINRIHNEGRFFGRISMWGKEFMCIKFQLRTSFRKYFVVWERNPVVLISGKLESSNKTQEISPVNMIQWEEVFPGENI